MKKALNLICVYIALTGFSSSLLADEATDEAVKKNQEAIESFGEALKGFNSKDGPSDQREKAMVPLKNKLVEIRKISLKEARRLRGVSEYGPKTKELRADERAIRLQFREWRDRIHEYIYRNEPLPQELVDLYAAMEAQGELELYNDNSWFRADKL